MKRTHLLLAILMLFIMVHAAPASCDPASAEDAFSKTNARHAVQQIQKRLVELGYAPGKLDGRWGQQTENALKKFQNDTHLLVTGKINSETKIKLGLIPSEDESRAEYMHLKPKNDKRSTAEGEIDFDPPQKPDLISTAPGRLEPQQMTIRYFDWLLFGSLLTLGFYHLCLFGLNKSEIATFYFGSLCLTTIFLYIVSGQNSLVSLFPKFVLANTLKIEYISIYVSFTIFLMYVESLYPQAFAPRAVQIAQCMGLLFAVATLATPAAMHRYLTMAGASAGLILSGYFIYVLARAIRQNLPGIILFVAGFIFLVIMIVSGSEYDQRIIHTGPFVSLGILIFFFVQAIVIQALLSSKSSGRDVVYTRFVPKEFIKNLGKADIADVKLGDNVEKDMSILFSDIRGFTTLSEQMTPVQNFNFINSYLNVMGPVIRSHRGFIDKYIGDAIMALFDKSADDAVMGAIAMLRQLGKYNEGRKRAGYSPIEIGIGINTGTLRIGTVGESGRMEGTVIGDAVNIASRTEGMTKIYVFHF